MDGPATGVLDGRSSDGWFGDGQEYRGVVGKTQQQRARKSTNQSEFSDGVVRASSPSTLNTRLIQTARARGIYRAGPGRPRREWPYVREPPVTWLCPARAATDPRCKRARHTNGSKTSSTRTGGQRSTRSNAHAHSRVALTCTHAHAARAHTCAHRTHEL